MFLLVAHFRPTIPAPGSTGPDTVEPMTAAAHHGSDPDPDPDKDQEKDQDAAVRGAAGSDPAAQGTTGRPDGQDQVDRRAVALLAAQPTTRWVRWAGSTEEPGHRVLVAEFASAADYRRALSPFDVRMTVVPWLSGADIGTSGVFEVRAAAGAQADGSPPPPGVLVMPDVTVTDPGR